MRFLHLAGVEKSAQMFQAARSATFDLEIARELLWAWSNTLTLIFSESLCACISGAIETLLLLLVSSWWSSKGVWCL